jgi:succinate-acetate transporter protein
MAADECREMAIGNSFGATVLSLYGGFWISVGIVFTPGGFNIMGSLQEAAGGSNSMFYDSLGLMLMVPIPALLPTQSKPANRFSFLNSQKQAWFISTIPMTLITLK